MDYIYSISVARELLSYQTLIRRNISWSFTGCFQMSSVRVQPVFDDIQKGIFEECQSILRFTYYFLLLLVLKFFSSFSFLRMDAFFKLFYVRMHLEL